MSDALEREHLAQADRHIAEARDRIARQKEVIAELARGGHQTDVAMSMLHALEHCLHAFEEHRKVVLDRHGGQKA
jgi:uncharacterized protein YigA (DUF484 family)